jgi:hypothetical protein
LKKRIAFEELTGSQIKKTEKMEETRRNFFVELKPIEKVILLEKNFV